MTTLQKPALRPASPNFSSGPCAKRPRWSVQALDVSALGRSHRAKVGKDRLEQAIALTRDILQVPADYRIGIVPASDTGAVEMALWSLLGARGVDMVAWESFGAGWVTDVVKQLKLADARTIEADYGKLPDLVHDRFRPRRCLHMERHDVGRASAECGFHPGGPARADDLRRHLGGLRATARFQQARCRHLLLAESARRRRRARHADPVAACGRAARKLQARLAVAEDLPADRRRQAQRRHLQGRNDQHPVDALRRRLPRRTGLGQGHRRARCLDRARRCEFRRDRPLCRRLRLARPSGGRRGDAFQHVGLPVDRRSRGHRA